MQYHAPENVSSVSVGGMTYDVDENGLFTVAPEDITADTQTALAEHGCVPVPEDQADVTDRLTANPNDEKRTLIADLARMGVKVDGRAKIEYIRAQHAKTVAENPDLAGPSDPNVGVAQDPVADTAPADPVAGNGLGNGDGGGA